MKFTIVATTHANLAAIQAVIAEVNRQGDVTYGPMTVFGFCTLHLTLNFESQQIQFIGLLTTKVKHSTIEIDEDACTITI
jgi:hypothetical protein